MFDSVSVGTTFREQLAEVGVIFCSFSHAVQHHPELIERYLGTVVPQGDNFYAALNSAVFSDGSFVYIPKGVRCPMELSSYFRINAANTGQFERTLIIAEEGSHVSYLEGCTAPQRDEHQLHAAVVELVAHDDAHIKYSTVQNWYPGDEQGRGGIYNFVTKRGLCAGQRSHIAWTQIETGSAITWKYPSVVLRGDDSQRRVPFDCGQQPLSAGRHRYQDDPSGPQHQEPHRLQRHQRRPCPEQLPWPGAHRPDRSRRAQPHPVRLAADRPRTAAPTPSPTSTPRATTRWWSTKPPPPAFPKSACSIASSAALHPEQATALIVGGFCQAVLDELPMEFALEAKALLAVSLEGAVG